MNSAGPSGPPPPKARACLRGRARRRATSPGHSSAGRGAVSYIDPANDRSIALARRLGAVLDEAAAVARRRRGARLSPPRTGGPCMTQAASFPWEAASTGPAAGLAAAICCADPRDHHHAPAPSCPAHRRFRCLCRDHDVEPRQPIGGPFTREEAWLDFSQLVAGWILRGFGLWAVETLRRGHARRLRHAQPRIRR